MATRALENRKYFEDDDALRWHDMTWHDEKCPVCLTLQLQDINIKKKNGHSNKQTAVKSGQKEQMNGMYLLYWKILDMVKWNLTIFYPNILSSYAIVGLGSAEVILT